MPRRVSTCQDGPDGAGFPVRDVRRQVGLDDAGQLAGIVERVRTGEKSRFETTNGIGQLIARMVAGDRPPETGRREPEIDNGP